MKIIILIILTLSTINLSTQNKCKDYMLLDGGESLRDFGLDSTDNWWAITAPFTNKSRLTVNGVETESYDSISRPIFSYDGNKWATYAKDAGTWYLLTEEETFEINSDNKGLLGFSLSSNLLAYSYLEAKIEKIIIGNQTVETRFRTSKLYLSVMGYKYAFIESRGSQQVLNLNGIITESYDNIKPIGFWMDGEFLYAVNNGGVWEVYKNDKAISESYSDITEVKINLSGTVAAFVASQPSGNQITVVISEEYYNNQISKQYDQISGLILHPTENLVAYSAKRDLNQMIVLNTSEYAGGLQTGKPFFTYDGQELLYLGCNTTCFLSINGRQYDLNTNFSLNATYAKKTNSKSIAYTTSATMIVRDLDNQKMYAGMMVDAMGQARYNWRQKEYQALGRIRNRLYLLTCKYD